MPARNRTSDALNRELRQGDFVNPVLHHGVQKVVGAPSFLLPSIHQMSAALMEIDMMGYLLDGDVPTDIRIASVRGGCGARTNLAMAEVVSDEARSLAILSVAVNSTFTPDELFGNISSNAVRNAECIDALAALADVDTDSRVAA